MKIVGLTGNIGAGKSTIARIFRELGVPVFDSDWAGKNILRTDNSVLNQIKNIFGDSVFQGNQIDRRRLADTVFGHPEKLEQLNQIIHPVVKAHFDNWVSRQSAPFVIREAAIMIESGSYLDLDAMILVTCPEEIRIRRVINRDSVTKEQVLARMESQLPEEEKKEKATFIIVNDGKELVIPQVLNIVKKIN